MTVLDRWFPVLPQVSLGLLVVVVVSNAGVVLGERGVPGLYWAVAALAAGVALTGVLREELRVPRAPVLTGALLFLASQALSVFVAADPGAAWEVLVVTGHAVVFLMVVMTLATAPRGPAVAGAAAVVTLAVLALASLAQEALGNATDFAGFSRLSTAVDLGGTTARHAGPLEDANFWGRQLALFLPIAVSFAVGVPERWQRRLAWGCVASLAIGIYLTQSRGSYLAVGLGIFVWLLLAGPRYRRVLRLSPIAAVAFLLLPGVGSRLQTIDITAAATGAGDPSLVGRLAVVQVALEAFESNPVLGVGAGNFEIVQPVYERLAGIDLPRPIAAHNLYAGIAAESGMVGLFAWAVFFALALLVPIAAVRRAPLAPDRGSGIVEPRLLLVGVVAGLSAWALAGVFLHLAHQQVLMIPVAIGAVVASTVRSRAATRNGAATALEPPLRAFGLWLLIAVVVTGAGARLALQREHVAAEVHAMVVPVATDDATAYDFDVAGRRVLAETYAAVLADARFEAAANEDLRLGQQRAARVSASAVPGAPIVIVSATADNEDDALRVALLAYREGVALLADVDPFYTLRSLGGGVVTRPSPTLVRDLVLACVAGVALAQMSLLGWRRWSGRHRSGGGAHDGDVGDDEAAEDDSVLAHR